MIVVGGEALIDLVPVEGLLYPVPGGGPLNTAIALGRLDVPVGFLGTLSRDDYGATLARVLTAAGVDTSLVCWSDAPTPLAMVDRRADGKGTYRFYLSGTAFTDLLPESLPPLPDEVWAIHVGTLSLALDPPAGAHEALLDREKGRRTIVVDPNVRPGVFGDPHSYRARFERIASDADIVKLSDEDASWIYPSLRLDQILDHLLSVGPTLVAITMGSAGALAASRHGRARVPAPTVAVADTVGAGDSFAAALLAALIERGALGPGGTRPFDDALIEEALTHAVTASAITCTRVGAVSPTRAEIDSWLLAADGSAPLMRRRP